MKCLHSSQYSRLNQPSRTIPLCKLCYNLVTYSLPFLPVYYRRALSINPSSPVLMCHVAVVQHAMQRTDRALDTLDAAIRLAPKGWTDDFVSSMLSIRV